MNRIPVLLITGFLGAGKTSFLNNLITQASSERFFVIENEVGKVNVDCQLVLTEQEDIGSLTAGCLCCSLHDELLDLLEEVSRRREEYTKLVIETTGVADPTSIIQTFLGNAMVDRVFSLQQVICLADARYIIANINETDEALRQVAAADVILLNKCDTVETEQLDHAQAVLNGVNPTAGIFRGEHGIFDLDKVLNTIPLQDERKVELTTLPANTTHQHNELTTLSFSFSQTFNLSTLSNDLYKVARLSRHQVYRIKGIIAVDRVPTRVVIQSVRDSIVLTDGPPWASEEERKSDLVFIGKNLQRKAIEKLLARHLE